jgi:hypothetical protein
MSSREAGRLASELRKAASSLEDAADALDAAEGGEAGPRCVRAAADPPPRR